MDKITYGKISVSIIIAVLILSYISVIETSHSDVFNRVEHHVLHLIKECEANGETLCNTGSHSLEVQSQIDRAILNSQGKPIRARRSPQFNHPPPPPRGNPNHNRPSNNRQPFFSQPVNSNTQNSNPRFGDDSHSNEDFSPNRNRQSPDRSNCPDTDVCCEKVSESQPISYYRNHDGWTHVASSNTNPQRTSFQKAECRNERLACRGVQALSPFIGTECVTRQRRQSILLYDTHTEQTLTRYVTLPGGCVCQLRRI